MTGQPRFRNPDKFQVLEFREYLREVQPTGPQGYVVEDLDLVLRVYGPNFSSDVTGRFLLAELKYGKAWINHAQKMTFGLVHSLLREADPHMERYLGYYMVQYDNEDWHVASFRINGIEVGAEDWTRFRNLDPEFLANLPEVL